MDNTGFVLYGIEPLTPENNYVINAFQMFKSVYCEFCQKFQYDRLWDSILTQLVCNIYILTDYQEYVLIGFFFCNTAVPSVAYNINF